MVTDARKIQLWAGPHWICLNACFYIVIMCWVMCLFWEALTHQWIQLIPAAGKQTPIYAETGEHWNIIGLEDGFLWGTKSKKIPRGWMKFVHLQLAFQEQMENIAHNQFNKFNLMLEARFRNIWTQKQTGSYTKIWGTVSEDYSAFMQWMQ